MSPATAFQHDHPAPLSACAVDPARSRGRRHAEAPSRTRTAFQRDRDRVVHAGAFRRLESKTQVFVHHEGDRWRTRLTHTLEAAQIARSLARRLGLEPDLAEAVALAHDIGHPPFGHVGEDALDAAVAGDGGFDHNAQTMRVLILLERRYPQFDGLNLTWETLEGALKHNGPVSGPKTSAKRPPPDWLAAFCADFDLAPDGFASLEAQIAALADDIAYINHDAEDGFRAGLHGLDELAEAPLFGPILTAVRHAFPGVEDDIAVAEAVRRLIGAMVDDLAAETLRRVAAAGVASCAEVRAAGAPMVGFSDAMAADVAALKRFQFDRMYRHFRINRMALKARRVIGDLFAALADHPDCLPPPWRARAEAVVGADRRRVVVDYIAGMTDRLALAEHARLFDPQARAWEEG
ncbi:MAG: deoxyguanosinetriphosphate triphosphohydrolase [Pseudomonadota bacterium]